MKYYFYFLAFLLHTSLLPMNHDQVVTLQVGNDKPFVIKTNLFTQCALGKATMHVDPNRPKHKFSHLKLIDGKALQTRDLLLGFNVLENQKEVNKIELQDIEHAFFVADFLGASESIKRALANRYKNLVGVAKLKQLSERKKKVIMRYISLKTIQDLLQDFLHVIRSASMTDVFLYQKNLVSIHDFWLLDKKFNLENITSIDLSHNNLTQAYLDKIFDACPNIYRIDLSHNQINKIDPSSFKKQPKKLCVLDLSNNKLTRFPAQKVKFLQEMIQIHLQENYLSQKEVQRIQQLFRLRKHAGILTALITAYFVVKWQSIGSICSSTFSLVLFDLALIVIAMIDYYDALHKNVVADNIIISTENQRTQD